MATVQQTSRIITVKIARQNADGTGKKFMTYKVPVEKWTTVLDAVLDVKKYMDHSIGIRYSCRQATCGSCGMVINGKPRLACFTKIDELDSDEVVIEPMKNFPIIRDLAVKFDRMFATHRKLKPYIIREDSDVKSGERDLIQTPEELEKNGCIIQWQLISGRHKVIGLCNSCPTMATDTSFVVYYHATRTARSLPA